MSEQASAQAADTPPVRSGAAAFIFVTILLDMLALGLIMPILPKLVREFRRQRHRDARRGSSACSAPPGR